MQIFLNSEFVVVQSKIAFNVTNLYTVALVHSEFITNQHRDTLSSHIGHYDHLSYYAVAQGDSIGRVKSQFLEKMLQPCGPPPKKKDEDINR